MYSLKKNQTYLNQIQISSTLLSLVGRVGFEPTYALAARFTVWCH